MKNHLHLLAIVASILLSISNINCKKGISDPVTLDKAAGKWSINAIRMKVFYGSILAKDSTVPWTPIVENYVNFDGVNHFNYCFNSASTTSGEYKLLQNDSINLKFPHEEDRWKILLLTSTNFNIEKTSTNNNAFPGATVITYQGFVR